MSSTIPLPALSIRPPDPPPDPLQQYGKALSLRGLVGQQQMQQQQLQAGAQENQLRQIQLQDQQAQTKAMQAWDGKDINDLPGLILKNGGSANAVFGTRQQILKYQTDQAQLSKDQLANEKVKNDYFAQGIENVKSLPPDQQPAAFDKMKADAVQSGHLDPQQAQQITYQGPQQLDMLQKTVMGHAGVIEAASKAAETQKNTNAALLDQNKLDIVQQYKANPQILAQQVNAAAPPAQYGDLNQRTMKAVQLAMSTGDVDSAKAAIKQASEEVGGIEKETNPGAQAAKLHLAVATKAAEQAITDGDPKAAGQLLISGAVAPSQLVSSRKPAFAQQAFTAATQMQPGWTAQKAEADFKVASSPQNVGFFGSAKSLTDKGGTLDQLADAAKDIPSHQIPVFNTVADALKASTGSGPIAKYAAIALGVADDYSKVMGGGQGSDTSRTQALNLITAKQSPQQRAASIEGIRGSVSSQINSRIGSNAVMRKMYGSELQSGGSSSSTPAAPTLTGKAAKWGVAPVGGQ